MLGSLRNHFFKHLGLLSSVVPFSSSTTNLPCMSTVTSSHSRNWGTSSYLSVQILCPKHVSDTLSEALLCFGASSTSIDLPDKSPHNDELSEALLSFGASSTSIHLPDKSRHNDEICINSIFMDCQDVNLCISHAADSIGLKETPSYKFMVNDNEWIKMTQDSFHPVEVTEGFWIVPEWTNPPDLQATNIILNPGFAFGTGDHPTTKLCLLLLRGLIKGGEVFLDYGTGSGVLGIAALKLGASLSVGIDIDPESVTSARQNAALNNIKSEKMQVYLVPNKTTDSADEKPCEDEVHSCQGMGFITDKYDIVIANILLNPLLELADQIISCAKPGGIIGISGILSEQLPRIVECYSQYLECISVSEMDGWACVSGTKRTDLRSH